MDPVRSLLQPADWCGAALPSNHPGLAYACMRTYARVSYTGLVHARLVHVFIVQYTINKYFAIAKYACIRVRIASDIDAYDHFELERCFSFFWFNLYTYVRTSKCTRARVHVRIRTRSV